ncbi:hypothetical protein, partial [Nocardioides sp.]|uniref:hypothetical protein n=1 Tax=Nocardioides sp. TaxID=35761 RepID=UPI003516F21B
MALGHHDTPSQEAPASSTGDLLTSIRDLDQAADQADRDRFIAIAEWADRHTTGQVPASGVALRSFAGGSGSECWQLVASYLGVGGGDGVDAAAG